MKNNEPILSIVVPVYNVARFLPELFTMLSKQTLKNFEVILVCDGKEEDFEICQNFVLLDHRFHLLSNINKGLGGARNAGLNIAKGRFLFFCDADDRIDEDFCEKLIQPFLEDPQIGFTACGVKIVFEGEIDQERKLSDDRYFSMPPAGKHQVTQDIFGSLNVGVWNKIYRRDIIQKYNIKFPENLYNEDAYFNWCYWSVCDVYYSLPDVQYEYLRHSDSLMGQTFSKNLGLKALHHLNVAEMFYGFLDFNSLLPKFNEAFWNCYLISYWFSKDFIEEGWQHKVTQRAYSFLINHAPPKNKKFNELREIFVRGNFQFFKKVSGDMLPPKIAITAVLPVFKCEQYLHRCIDSILSQTLANIEIILAVDGGEACYCICDEYAAKDSRIKVIKDKGSYGKSVNSGILAATGEYIAIIECDDWCEPDMFEVLYSVAKKYEADVVKGGWFDSYDDPRKDKTRLFDYPDGFLNVYEHQEFFQSQPSIWSAIYRKEYLIKNKIFFNGSRQSFVDAPFHYKTLYCTEDYVLINKPLYHYYQDNPNQSVQSGGKIYDGINSEKFAYEDIKQYPGLWAKIGTGIFSAILEHVNWNDRRIKDSEQHKLFVDAAKNFLMSIDLTHIDFSKVNKTSIDLFNRICGRIHTDKWIFRLLGFFPLFSIEKREGLTKIKLFTKINLFSIRENETTKRYNLCKFIPLLVIRRR